MKDNLELWNRVREVPKEAQKKITGGRLNGFTDINPMFRLKTLTSEFGRAGEGWYFETTSQWLEGTEDEKTAHCNIKLYVKYGDEWSKPIEGTGGAGYITKQTKGYYINDEAFKMAQTDALSVACKMLGVGADIYWDKDNTKYNDSKKDTEDVKDDTDKVNKIIDSPVSDAKKKAFIDTCKKMSVDPTEILKKVGWNGGLMTNGHYGMALKELQKVEVDNTK